MNKIALLPEGLHYRTAYLDEVGIPDKYMEDYSVLGLVVDRFHESIAILDEAGFKVEHSDAWAMISLDRYTALSAVLRLLADKRIHCNYQDIADTLYQS